MKSKIVTAVANPSGEPTSKSRQHVDLLTAILSEQPARTRDRRIARERTEMMLDEALDNTFPASDPVALSIDRTDASMDTESK
jgi:hypothetical protein